MSFAFARMSGKQCRILVDPSAPGLSSRKLHFAGAVVALSKTDATVRKPKMRIRIGEFEGSDLFLVPVPGSQLPASPFFVPAWCVKAVKPDKAADATCALEFSPSVKLDVPMASSAPGDSTCVGGGELGLGTVSVDVRFPFLVPLENIQESPDSPPADIWPVELKREMTAEEACLLYTSPSPRD
eukprot:15142051-Alexandrium_andersonii.AAC.1